MDSIEVKLKFFGSIATALGTNEMTLSIHKERESGLQDITSLIKEKAGDQILFMILLNNTSVYLVNKPEFDGNDEFSVVPIVLGG